MNSQAGERRSSSVRSCQRRRHLKCRWSTETLTLTISVAAISVTWLQRPYWATRNARWWRLIAAAAPVQTQPLISFRKKQKLVKIFWVKEIVSPHCSVTRFGEISPLWRQFTSLWQIVDGLFLILQNVNPILANLLHNWANFHCCKWPNIEK